MVVLTRKTQESVVAGWTDSDEPMLTVTVLEITGGKVKLGFNGNPDVFVHRSEVWDRVLGNGRLDSPNLDVVAVTENRAAGSAQKN